jgi:hypothetical protein
MKKLILLLGGYLVFIWAAQVAADALVEDIDILSEPLTNESLYWKGKDYNALWNNQLENSNEETEEAWLEALLGYAYNDPGLFYIDRVLAGQTGLGSDVKQLSDYNPGFAWDYAVVKYGNYWIAISDTDQDHRLTTPEFTKGVSHITFFQSASSLPEPASVILICAGLIGLVGLKRKFRK